MAEVLGGKAVPEVEHASTVGMVLEKIPAVMVSSNWGPRNFNEAPVPWRRRCFNKDADHLANLAMDSKHDFHYVNDLVYNRGYHNISNIQGWCDGGSRCTSNVSSHAWIIKAWFGNSGPYIVVAGGMFLHNSATSSFSVEVQGMLALWRDLSRILKCSKPLVHNTNRDQKSSGGLLDANLFKHTGWQL